MITFSEYCGQLRSICVPGLKDSALVTHVHLSEVDQSIIFRTALPSSIASSRELCYLEFKITYSNVYQEPLLLFRLWKRPEDPKDGIDFISPYFPQDVAQMLGIDDSLTVSLDAIFSNSTRSQETWFSFHPCDTAEIVGDHQDFKGNYLNRWLSIFLFSWLAKG